MNTNAIPYLTCPSDHKSPLIPESELENSDGEIIEGKLRCPSCKIYPIEKGIIDFLPELPKFEGIPQKIKHYTGSAKLYEILIRRSFLLSFCGYNTRDEMLKMGELRPVKNGDIILDVACGTGIYTREMAKKNENGQLIGLDLSWPMLKQAVKYIHRDNIENINYLRGDAQNLPFPDNIFDVVNCCGALHLFPNPDKFFQEVLRVLKPGGIFGCWTMLTEGKNILQDVTLRIARDWYKLHLSKDEGLENQLIKMGFSEYKSESSGIMILFSAKK